MIANRERPESALLLDFVPRSKTRRRSVRIWHITPIPGSIERAAIEGNRTTSEIGKTAADKSDAVRIA
jgi:hypothetical protein